MNRRVLALAALLLGLAGCFSSQKRGQAPDENETLDADIKAVRVLSEVTADTGGSTGTPISGVGLVGGLNGTGGGSPPGDFRRMLEEHLMKKGVKDVKGLLMSPDYTMVLVSTLVPVGTRKGDLIDVEVTLPQGSRATSLRGGYLYECPMMDYQATPLKQGGVGVLKGHVLAHASGPILVDYGDSTDESRLRRGIVWHGASSHIDSPYILFLKNDSNVASVANAVANRINLAFPDDAQKQFLARQKRFLVLDEVANGINEKFHTPNGMGRGETALATGNGAIYVNVPLEYAYNPERFRRVVQFVPLRDSPEAMAKYRKRLHDTILDPKETIYAALRLEALGKDSVPALQKGLNSDHVLVRFACAESLTYLGNNSGVDELARLSEQYDILRGACCMALASLNEVVTRNKLTAMLKSPVTEVRIGAFRSLLLMAEAEPQSSTSSLLNGEMLNETFWLHHVAPTSKPLVHIATKRRAEIVVFGESPTFVAPLRMISGPKNGTQFTISAEAGDERCTISRYDPKSAEPVRKQCAFKLEAIIHTMAALGAQFSDVAELLREASASKQITSEVASDSLPFAVPLDLLAACGADSSRFRDDPEKQEEVVKAQQSLGLVQGGRLKTGQ